MNECELCRRTFLGRGLAGLGLLGLNALLRPRLFAAETTTSLGVVNPLHLSRQGQARHLSVPGGRAFAPGDLRLQAEARRDERQAHARIDDQGPADRAAPGQAAHLLRPAVRLQEIRQIRPGDLRAVSAHRQRGGRYLHHPLHVDGADQSRSRPHHHEHRHRSCRGGRAWARGSSTAWARRRRICRASWCCSPPDAAARCSRSPRGNGLPAFCPASSRA